MQINTQILSIPPYLSTTWDNVTSLKTEGGSTLVILLKEGGEVKIPSLNQEDIQKIFDAHKRAVELQIQAPLPFLESPFSFSLPFKEGGGLDSLATSLQHNPSQANIPPIPPEVLKKIILIARAFGLEDASLAPFESGCNCPSCQLARAFREEDDSSHGEEVTQEDLQFRDWDIKQTGDQLYQVTNPLDETEQYNVFLGTPLGCTCGSKNCEHIRAVLNT